MVGFGRPKAPTRMKLWASSCRRSPCPTHCTRCTAPRSTTAAICAPCRWARRPRISAATCLPTAAVCRRWFCTPTPPPPQGCASCWRASAPICVCSLPPQASRWPSCSTPNILSTWTKTPPRTSSTTSWRARATVCANALRPARWILPPMTRCLHRRAWAKACRHSAVWRWRGSACPLR